MKLLRNTIMLLCSFLFVINCSKNNNTPTTTTTSSKTIQITPVTHNEAGFGAFTKKSIVFGIHIYASSSFPDNKVEHTANILAKYLDNDEDGIPDNPDIVDTLYKRKAFMLLIAKESDVEGFTASNFPAGPNGQDLGAAETFPEWHTNGGTGHFDATLEEVLHLITSQGYHHLYPQVFGEMVGSEIANAMDIARGGQYTEIPPVYPSQAWYTYDDSTCDYNCQVSEYIYWLLTSILGAQANANRFENIKQEWQLNTLDLVKSRDLAGYKLMTNPIYKWPTILPDGSYNPKIN